jgi:hypothetical protein
MGQVTLYLDEKIEELMKQAAESAGKSRSRWVAEVISERLGSSWPDDVKELFGAWSGDSEFPEAEELRRGLGEDVPRETL